MFGKILLGIEALIGILIILTAYFNGRPNIFTEIIGIELTLRNGVMVLGGFYFLKSLIQLVREMAEPSNITIIKRILILFESVAGFIMIITSYCDGKTTAFEQYFGTHFTVNHGLVFLGVFYISKAFFQVVLERGEATELSDI